MEKSFLAAWLAQSIRRPLTQFIVPLIYRTMSSLSLWRSIRLPNGVLRVETTSGKSSFLWTSSKGVSYCTNSQRGEMHSDPSPRSYERIPPRSISIGDGPHSVFPVGTYGSLPQSPYRNDALTKTAARPVYDFE